MLASDGLSLFGSRLVGDISHRAGSQRHAHGAQDLEDYR